MAAEMKPVIAILFPSLRRGGVQRSMTNLAQSLSKHGYSVYLVVAQVDENFRSQIPQELGVVNLNARSMFRALPALVRYLKQDRPACLISSQMHVNLNAIIACQLSRTDSFLVISEHNDVHSVYRNATTVKGRLVPWLARLLYKKADRIVAVSGGVADGLATWLGMDRDKIHVIHNPLVNGRIFQEASESLDHPWFQSGQPPVVLTVGRLEKQKDHETLIRAFARVVEQIPARLVILGEGGLRKTTQALIVELGLETLVELPGFVSNPFAYMGRAAVFVLSSAWEGLPGVLVEAMACGCPLVSTDCPSGPAEILENGKWGALVPVGDSDALSQAILAAIKNPPPEGLQEAARQYSIEKGTQDYLRLLQGMKPG